MELVKQRVKSFHYEGSQKKKKELIDEINSLVNNKLLSIENNIRLQSLQSKLDEMCRVKAAELI